ncbi:MAG TPA: acyl-CoA desaturase [Cyanobacteria bacterium UBA8803]|nr:acyl-CoA desaturase [Cyanobacteria bacterium UBA9273]HBL60705.1 acyl-CoA desaturase [Cyanobacteria bacterium UBA8803]
MTTSKIIFAKEIGFRKELNRRVSAYLAAEQISERDNPAMYLKTAILLAWIVSAWSLIVFGPISGWMRLVGCVILAFGMAGFVFNVGHDANHGGYSNHKLVNRILGLTYDFMGVSSYLWRYRHNVLHHTYTNISGHDVEIDGDGWLRMYPTQTHHWYHRFQHLYIWFIYCFVPFYWSYCDVDLVLRKGKYHEHRIPPLNPSEKITLLGFKILWFGYVFGIPLLVGYTPLQVIVGVLVTFLTYGLVINVVFMMAHVVDSVEFLTPQREAENLEDEWAIWQVKTTVDFAPNNHFINWYVGGLNYQVVHHLFPQICHIHYPRLAKIVAEVCQEFGVDYKVYETFGQVLNANYSWLKTLGREPDNCLALKQVSGL